MIKLTELLLESIKYLTLYHGTNLKFINNIKINGLISRHGYETAGWYMLSSDFESALFHANPEKEGMKVVVIEFKIMVTNEKWKGYPYLWPPTKRSDKSEWYALKQPIPKKFIKKIHYVSYENWTKQKNLGF